VSICLYVILNRMSNIMSRGPGSMQKTIMEALEGKGGRASTKVLMEAIGVDSSNQSKKVSFYRALNGLQGRGLITWYKEHGGPNSPSGLVSITRTNVLLVDVDSTIANLALMKISSWHKKQGHNVDLQRGLHTTSSKKYDFVYLSCIFTWNASETRMLAKQFPDSEVRIGGSGVLDWA